MTAYTPHELEVSYTGQYPDMVEFEKPWETSIQVGQGQGKVSKDGKPLQSEGFSKCFGLILRNSSNLESALFHVDDIDLTHRQTPIVDELIRNYVDSLDLDPREKNRLLELVSAATRYWNPNSFADRGYNGGERQYLKDRMTELNSEETIQACFIRGDDSRDVRSRIVDCPLSYLGVNVVDDLVVNTGRQHWSMVYKPNEARIYIDARNQKRVLKFTF